MKMKVNLFDLFEGYDGEVPEIREEPCSTGRIEQLVMQKTGTARIRQTKKRRLPVMIAAAAAAAAVFGVTAAAVSGRLDLFKNVLGRTVLSDAENLPLMNDAEDSAEMEQFLHENDTVFAGDSSLQISTVGMYSDNNTMMLTLEIIPQNGQSLPENALFVPYFYRADGSLIGGGAERTEQLTADPSGNAYYLTYYLTAPELAGTTVRAELKNAYTQTQLNAVYAELQAAQAQWRADYGADSMLPEDWKALRKSENLDARTAETEASLLENSDAVLRGTWSAEIAVPETAAPRVFASDDFRVTADSLSLTAENFSGDPDVGSMITLTDGTKLTEPGGTSEKQALYDAGILSADDTVKEFAYGRSADGREIFCYSEPVQTADIAAVTVLHYTYGGGVQATAEQLLPQ